MVANATRWTIVVNGQTVANNDASAIGSFDLQIPIGHVLDSSDSEWKSKSKHGIIGAMMAPHLRLVANRQYEVTEHTIEYDEPGLFPDWSHDLQEDGEG